MIKFGVLSWLPTRLGSFFLRKTRADNELRHMLVCASMPQQGGAYCEARLELYRNMTEQLLMRDRVSSVAATSLPVIYYARFLTMYNLVLRHSDLLGVEQNPGLKKFLECYQPDQSYCKHIEMFRSMVAKMPVASYYLYKVDAHQFAMLMHFEGNVKMTQRYLFMERRVFEAMDGKGKESRLLREKFNGYNEWTMQFLQESVASDIRNLTPAGDRLYSLFSSIGRRKGL